MFSLEVHDDFVAPFNPKGDKDGNQYILLVGYKAYQIHKQYTELLKKTGQEFNQLELKEQYDKLAKEESEKFNKQINNLKSEYKICEEEYKGKLQNIKDKQNLEINEQELRIVKIKDQNRNEIEKLENENKLLRTKSIEEISLIRTKHDETIHNLKETHDEDIKKIKEELQTKIYRTENEKSELSKSLITKIEEYTNRSTHQEKYYLQLLSNEREYNKTLTSQLTALTKPVSAVETGIIGEELVSRWITNIFNSSEIINQTKMSNKGDLHVKINNKVFLIEVKNKAGGIYKIDIDKFIRDITLNKDDIHGGLFVSLVSNGIPNKGDFSLEYIEGIPVIYIYAPDQQTLKTAIKALSFLNNKTDNTTIILTINQLFTKLNATSLIASSLERSVTESKSSVESLKREIKEMISEINSLYEDNPDIKNDPSTSQLDYSNEEIKMLCEVYANNKKAKMDDYAKALNVITKYLQARGGAAKIKSIVQPQPQPTITFNNTRPNIPLPTFSVSPPVLQIN